MSAAQVAAEQALQRPLPAADATVVRMAALRSSAVAAQLLRVRAALDGALAAGSGWSGAAERAFEESVASRLSLLGPIADRYEGYAAALTAYAQALEAVQPRVRASRSRLAGTVGEPVLPADAAAADQRLLERAGDFDRAWQEWDRARLHCIARLARAGRSGADAAGFSGFLHAVGRVAGAAARHVQLADLSRELGQLADVLVAVGLVLSVVCPPAAGVVWAAVAVTAVAKLAVDGVRYQRGDSGVGGAELAWDVAGVLPVGRGLRKVSEAERAGREIERLALGERVSRLVPGGGLAVHEAAGGHTIARHVGKSEHYLRGRLRDSRRLTRASTFIDRQTAERSVADAMAARGDSIRTWLASGDEELTLNWTSATVVGATLRRTSSAVQPAARLTVCLRKESSMPCGFRILTSYPTP
jgi:hypothetical protein